MSLQSTLKAIFVKSLSGDTPKAACLVVTLLSLFLITCASPDKGDARGRDNPTVDRDGPPNILYILADDLGYSELGCYGQKKIRTPNIDRLAQNGIRFTQHYSGSAVCAPTRCMLLTGKHAGHAYIRDNDEMGSRGDVWNDPSIEGQRPLPEGTETLGTLFQRAGYRTACIGKWGLGWHGSSGDPKKQGFDHFYGYICQRVAHNYYPTHMWNDGRKEKLDNPYFKAHQRFPKEKDSLAPDSYESYSGNDYAPDFMLQDTLEFIRENPEQPFFIYWCTPVPHLALQVPDDSLQEYVGKFDDKPYDGSQAYLPHLHPRAAYAAMITRMDRDIGTIIEELRRLGLYENTLIMFSSDNGPTFCGGTDSEYFDSASGFSGLKCSLKEGGIRVPMIASWPGRIEPDRTTDHLSAHWDVMATLADVLGIDAPHDTDGISFLPTLLNKGEQKKHEYLYWEYKGQQAVRTGNWKGYRKNAKKSPDSYIEVFDLNNDPGETINLREQHPEIEKALVELMNRRKPSVFDKWNFAPAKTSGE